MSRQVDPNERAKLRTRCGMAEGRADKYRRELDRYRRKVDESLGPDPREAATEVKVALQSTGSWPSMKVEQDIVEGAIVDAYRRLVRQVYLETLRMLELDAGLGEIAARHKRVMLPPEEPPPAPKRVSPFE